MPAHTVNTTTEEDGARHLRAERITVALIPQAAEDLRRLLDRTSLSRTDITNRAITLYEFIDGQIRKGRDVLLRDSETREIQIVRLL
jgi:hypothetical protein